MKRILIIDGHPDPDDKPCVHRLSAGHDVETIWLANLDFPLLRSNAEFYGGVLVRRSWADAAFDDPCVVGPGDGIDDSHAQ